jgi:uncharacterized protein YndB with AHSA1/START domain
MLYGLIALCALIGLVLVLASRKPDQFRVSRTITIAAPPERIFPYISGLTLFNSWSPFAKMDPTSKVQFDGEDFNLGSSLSWKGGKTGEGRMTLIEAEPQRFTRYRMDFIKPFAAVNMAEFSLSADGAGTRVEWSISGDNNFIRKLMIVLLNCDNMTGTMFEKGLADLKAMVEQPAV